MLDRDALKAILSAVARGDGAAFRNLYLDRAGHLYALALRSLNEVEDAQEALQQTFVEIWRLANSEQADWVSPDLEMIRLCRNYSKEVALRSGRARIESRQFEMSNPVQEGTASFELLELLNTLGRMSEACRNVLTIAFFEFPTRETLSQRLSLTSEELTASLRRCYAEYLTISNVKPTAIDRETDLIAMNQALGVSPLPGNAGHDPLMRAWELRLAPLAELLVPVPPPNETFDAIMLRINADENMAGAKRKDRRSQVMRAVLFMMVAALASAVVYFGLVAISQDAAASTTTILEHRND